MTDHDHDPEQEGAAGEAGAGSGLRGHLSESAGALADVFRTADLRRLGFAYLTSLIAL